MKRNFNKHGFTLIELLAAITILGVIMIIAVPNVINVLLNNRAKTYVDDSKKMATSAEYEFKKDTSIAKPAKGACIIMSLSFLDNSTVKKGPNGGNYAENKSFVVIKRTGENSYEYYTRLVEKTEKDTYRGINLENIKNYKNKKAKEFVDDIDKVKLFDVDNYSTNPTYILNKLKIEGIECSGLATFYEKDREVEDAPPICGTVTGGSTTWTKSNRTISVKCVANGSECFQESFSKTFNSTVKTSSIMIKDKNDLEEECIVNVYVDKDAPSTPKIVNPTNGKLTYEPFSLTLSSSDVGSGIKYWQYKYADTSWTTYSSSKKNTFVTPKFEDIRNEYVYVRACDQVGNCSSASKTRINIGYKDGWHNLECKKYYVNNKPLVGWQEISSAWYYFNSDGCMQTGWLSDKKSYPNCTSGWWYLNTNGKMATGWKEVSGKWYYLAKKDGKENRWQAEQPMGCMYTGWVYSEDYACATHGWYFGTDGAMLSNTIIDNAHKLDSSGCWIEDVQTYPNTNGECSLEGTVKRSYSAGWYPNDGICSSSKKYSYYQIYKSDGKILTPCTINGYPLKACPDHGAGKTKVDDSAMPSAT